MYDGTDVALVLGGLLSVGLAGISLIIALISLGLCLVHKSKNQEVAASFSGKLALFFFIAAVLCGMSIPCGLAVYGMFEHQRGYSNPPSHVIAVAFASVLGPVAASIFGVYWLLKRQNLSSPM
jgi:hypothetical protein